MIGRAMITLACDNENNRFILARSWLRKAPRLVAIRPGGRNHAYYANKTLIVTFGSACSKARQQRPPRARNDLC